MKKENYNGFTINFTKHHKNLIEYEINPFGVVGFGKTKKECFEKSKKLIDRIEYCITNIFLKNKK